MAKGLTEKNLRLFAEVWAGLRDQEGVMIQRGDKTFRCLSPQTWGCLRKRVTRGGHDPGDPRMRGTGQPHAAGVRGMARGHLGATASLSNLLAAGCMRTREPE